MDLVGNGCFFYYYIWLQASVLIFGALDLIGNHCHDVGDDVSGEAIEGIEGTLNLFKMDDVFHVIYFRGNSSLYRRINNTGFLCQNIVNQHFKFTD